MIRTHILGYPRIGARRELKFALEAYWQGRSDATALEGTAKALRHAHWQKQIDAGLDFLTVGDFALYDHVLDHILLFSAEPPRFAFTPETAELERAFAMARGRTGENPAAALEMTKWFDTNYHYLVPEFHADTRFTLAPEPLLARIEEARAFAHPIKVVLLGPLTFLWLGKEKSSGFSRLDLLDRLLPVYVELAAQLKARGVEWIQMDEPILGLDLPAPWVQGFERCYARLASAGPKLLLASYFSPMAEHARLACQLPVAGLHVDWVRAPEDLARALDWLPAHKILSLGLIDGRNVWAADLDRLASLAKDVASRREEVWLAPSCSLLHVPVSLREEEGLDAELKSWLAFADEKLAELRELKRALVGEVVDWTARRQALAARRLSPRVHRPEVAARLAAIDETMARRASPYPERRVRQRARLHLPLLPTTTIGSFPQTAEIRAARAAWRRGELSDADYREAMRREIQHAVAAQERLDLDVLVHGEAERNDMVEYFGEMLEGFAFTRHGWVQSYGSRCVKPPIIYGDVWRPRPMTVEWAVYAQSLTSRPMKGMLTGPITMLQWSFVRDDVPRSTVALSLALALREEVGDLEAAGIQVIQIDEPALREGLPLREGARRAYLDWAVQAFRIASAGVRDETQIHTHMCYAEFQDILPDIAAMDADVISIETSRSGMELLDAFAHFRYPNEIGPGVYDIHSPRIPSVEEMQALIEKAAQVIPPERLWVNPDCGLKTRAWPEVEAALANMVEAARRARRKLAESAREHA